MSRTSRVRCPAFLCSCKNITINHLRLGHCGDQKKKRMQNVDLTKLNKKDEFIRTCLERFGSMNKNDYEVELFYLLQQSEYGNKSDHALSTMMQIPLTKVRRLRYEANLKHPKDENIIVKLFSKSSKMEVSRQTTPLSNLLSQTNP